MQVIKEDLRQQLQEEIIDDDSMHENDNEEIIDENI